MKSFEYPLSIAPMMDCTDRHFRFFMRLMTRRTLLYTEMIPVGAILKGDRERHLGFSPEEKPLILQIGGDDPQQLAEAAKVVEAYGYDGINLNVGCPSSRVRNGNFGACLMAHPEKVALAVKAMIQATDMPVTVKHRIGIDDLDAYEDMKRFVKIVASAGCKHFIVHARKAWLNGLSPKENRTIPPLRYEDVYRLKKEFPNLIIEINGGIKTFDEVKKHLTYTDAVMIGREAANNPYRFASADQLIYQDINIPIISRREVIENMLPYLERFITPTFKLHRMTLHMLNLFHGQKGSKVWKRFLSENAYKDGAGVEVVQAALERVYSCV